MRRIALITIALALVASTAAVAGPAKRGVYIGGSIGQSNVESDVQNPSLPDVGSFDESDFAWKLYGGYNWVLAKTFGFGIEGGYVNFGSPSDTVLAVLPVKIEPTALDLFATLGFDIGPVGIFGKVGYAWWDVDVSVDNATFSDDGSDPVYGVGARFNLWSLEIRGEYEFFDVDDVDDLALWTIGVVWRF